MNWQYGPWGAARNLSLERYEAAFRDNEIDDTVLPSPTTEVALGPTLLSQFR